jgi:hypothetical protein
MASSPFSKKIIVSGEVVACYLKMVFALHRETARNLTSPLDQFSGRRSKAFIQTIKPDIDFSANGRPSGASVLSLAEFLQRGIRLNQEEAPPVRGDRRKKS